MAKSAAKPNVKPTVNGNSQVQFLNYDLPDNERKAFKIWASDASLDLIGLIEKLLDDGYGLSVKWDDYNDCAGAFIQCKKPDNANFGWILTGRGKTAFSAISGVLYRHYVLFEQAWPTDNFRRQGLDDD